MNQAIKTEEYLSKEEIRVLTNFSEDSRLSNRIIRILKESNEKYIWKLLSKIKKHNQKSF